MLPVTSLGAVVLSALFVALTVRVIAGRRSERVGVGSGSDRLARAIRAQGNFAECTPIVLLLSALAELNGAPTWLLGAVFAVFVAGRLAHAYGLSAAELRPRPDFRFRVAGMVTTFATIGLLAATLLVRLALAAG